MSHNLTEFKKIAKASDGWFGGRTRRFVAQELDRLCVKMGTFTSARHSLGELTPKEKLQLHELLRHYLQQREEAVATFRTGYRNAKWAASVACATWISAILHRDPQLEAIEQEVLKLIRAAGHLGAASRVEVFAKRLSAIGSTARSTISWPSQ